MTTIIINKNSLADFLSGDGTVTGKRLERRMARYCAYIESRIGELVLLGDADRIPDEIRDEFGAIADLASNNLDLICDFRRSVKPRK